MKKVFSILVLALLATNIFAQNQDHDILLASSNDKKGNVEMFSHLGFGYNIVKSDAIQPKDSWEFLLNILEASYYPVENFGFQIGVDLLCEWFDQKGNTFFLNPDREVRTLGSDLNKLKGGFSTLSFNAPLLLKYRSGDFSIGAGVDGSLNVTGNAYYSYKENKHRTNVNENKAKVNTLSYGFMGAISYDGFGLYLRYHPKSSKLLSNSFEFSYFTIGLIWGF